MKRTGTIAVMICVISFAAPIVFADYCTITRMPTRTNSSYEESVPARSAEVITVRNEVLVEEVDINNCIEKAPSKTPGANIVKNADVASDVSIGQLAGWATLSDGTRVEFYSYEDYNSFFTNNIDNIQGATSIYINDLTSGPYMGAISNDYSSGSIAGYGSSIVVSYDSYITQVGEDIIIAPLVQYEGSIVGSMVGSMSGYFDQGQIASGAGSTISVSSSMELTETLPIEKMKDRADTKSGYYNKNVRDRIDKRNKEIRSRIDEI